MIQYDVTKDRAELRYGNLTYAVLQSNEDVQQVQIERWVQFSNWLRSILEYILRRDHKSIIYVMAAPENGGVPRIKFEMKRLVKEIHLSALIVNSSIKRLVEYKKPCLKFNKI